MADVDLFSSNPDDCNFHPSGWVDIGGGIEVTALPLWDSRQGVFARLSPVSAAKRLEQLGARLPKPAELEEHRAHAMFIEPYPMSDRPHFEVHMRSLAWCREHDTMVWHRAALINALASSATPALQVPLQNAGKHWTFGGGIFGWFVHPLPSRLAIQGYHQDGSVSYTHAGSEHTDYATTTMATRAKSPITQPTKEPPPMPLPTAPPQPTKPGDKGEPVRAWQRYLILNDYRDNDGRQLKVDGDHGPRTEQATVKWRVKMSESEPPRPAQKRIVPAVRTKVGAQQLAEAMASAHVTVVGRAPDSERLGIAWAQVWGETGAGVSSWNHNLGNIKCTPGWPECMRLKDEHPDWQTNQSSIYRSYPSFEASAEDYWRLMLRRYGEALEAMDRGDTDATAVALKHGVGGGAYYEAPLATYQRGLRLGYAEFRRLGLG